MRVPAIAWWPGTVEPGVTSIVASAMDLYSTSLSLGGAEWPNDRVIDGRDLSAFLRTGELPPRKPIFFYHGRELYACRLGPWKAHFHTRPPFRPGGPKDHETPLLFHLPRDPSERRLRPISGVGEKALVEIEAAVKEHQAGLEGAAQQLD